MSGIFRTSTEAAVKYDAHAHLAWVDEFIANVRPYIFVREEDHLLIKRPNHAQKLNATGARILKILLDGKPIRALLAEIGTPPERVAEVTNFLTAVKQQLEGTLDQFAQNPAVAVTPFESPFSTYPVLAEVALTYRCNLRCAFCYAGCNCTANPTGSAAEMTSVQVETVLLKIFHQAQVPSVSFTGGEPALIPELPDYIRYAKELGMRVNLITNGTQVTPELARVLAKHGLASAQVSLEGVTAETHDALVGLRGAYQQSAAAVRHLKDAGILTHTNTTITRANLHECVEFPRFVKETFQNDKFSMNLMIPTGSGAQGDRLLRRSVNFTYPGRPRPDWRTGTSAVQDTPEHAVNDGLLVHYHEIGEYLEDILAASQREGVEFMWYSPVPLCFFNSITHGLGNKGCSACDGLLSVGANGDVLPCASFDAPVGNLVTQDFLPIWQSAEARKYRQKELAHPQCQTCEHFAVCDGACPLYWRHVGFEELNNNQECLPLRRKAHTGIL